MVSVKRGLEVVSREGFVRDASLLPKKEKDTEKEYLRGVSRKVCLLSLILLLDKIFTTMMCR